MLDEVIAFGRIIASSVALTTKAVLVNLRVFEPLETVPDTEAECSPDEPFFGALGVVSRPDPPDAGGFCEVMAARTGDGAQPFAARDLRISKRTNPAEGEVILGHYGGGMVSLKWNKDRTGTSVTIMAPKLTGDMSAIDASSAIILDSQEAKPSLVLMHRMGQNVCLNHQGKILLLSANGQNFIEVGDDGLVLSGVLNLNGGIVAGTAIDALPVALFPPLALAFTALAKACTALAGVGALSAAATALGEAATACTAAAVPAAAASVALKASPK